MSKQPDFESALRELEELTRNLESGELSLDDSIKAYSRGMELQAICQGHLKKAEEKITLLEKKGGEVTSSEVSVKPGESPDRNEIQGTLL